MKNEGRKNNYYRFESNLTSTADALAFLQTIDIFETQNYLYFTSYEKYDF
jgi:hypothetical protein